MAAFRVEVAFLKAEVFEGEWRIGTSGPNSTAGTVFVAREVGMIEDPRPRIGRYVEEF